MKTRHWLAAAAALWTPLALLALDIDLSGEGALMNTTNQAERIPIRIPGGVHAALLAAGRMPDTYWGANEKGNQWVAKESWTIERAFDLEASVLAHKAVTLRLEDVDTFADIYLNGVKIGETSSRFERYDFDAKAALKPGRNVLTGVFRSAWAEADRLAAAYDHAYPMANVPWCKNQALIRKPACHAGWDWGPAQMTAGFCGTVKLIAFDEARVDYVYTTQTFSDDLARCDLDITVEGTRPDGAPCRKTERRTIANPQLWWPSGMGGQPLTEVSVEAFGERIVKRLALRRLEVVNERTKSADGKDELSMTFAVNGVRLFAKGANWIPCDAYADRQTPDRYRDLLTAARDAHMNMVRLWGGGQYEKDVFYELCDELGLLVWHDFMFSCAVYPFDARMQGHIARELAHQLRRLRDYGSIALWCGDNECLGAINWFPATKAEPDFYRDKWVRRSRLQEELVKRYDPARTYWPSSPCCGPGDFGNAWKTDSRGDMHNWIVWHENKDFEAYYQFKPRFCSEFGYQSLSSPEVARTYATAADVAARGPDFEWHQKNPGGNAKIAEMMTRYFKPPKDTAAMQYLSMVQQAMGVKMAIEAWRSQMPRCMGTLIWQLNDNWPVASWSMIEYGGKWKPLHHMARRFFAPVAACCHPDGSLYVMNDAAAPLETVLHAEYRAFDGAVVKSLDIPVSVPARAARKVGAAPEVAGTFLVFWVDGRQNDFWFRRCKDCDLRDPRIAMSVDGFTVTLTATAPAFFTWISAEGIRGEFDDNCFTLLPDRSVTLTFRPKESVTPAAFRQALTVTSLYDTF